MFVWSATKWLIAICVVLYCVDAFAPRSMWLDIETHREVDTRDSTEPFHSLKPKERDKLPEFRARVYDGTGRDLGYIEYQRMPPVTALLHFSTRRLAWPHVEFWRLIGFQFLHGNVIHIAFNMLALFIFGPLVEDTLGRKRYLAFFLLCGIFGALMYMLLNVGGQLVASLTSSPVLIPGLLFSDPAMPLVGASAGVFGIIVAGAYLHPRDEVLLFFLLPIRLPIFATILVISSLLAVLAHDVNAGGQAAHLGGAIAGYYFIRNQHHLHGFFDILGRADPTSHHYRKDKKRPQIAVRGTAGSGFGLRNQPDAQQSEVNRILDKIKVQGINSLTNKEKRTLEEASRG